MHLIKCAQLQELVYPVAPRLADQLVAELTKRATVELACCAQMEQLATEFAVRRVKVVLVVFVFARIPAEELAVVQANSVLAGNSVSVNADRNFNVEISAVDRTKYAIMEGAKVALATVQVAEDPAVTQ